MATRFGVAGVERAPLCFLGRLEEGDVVAVRQLHAFRVAGRARRVELNRVVFGFDLQVRVFGVLTVAPFVVGGPCRVAAVDGDDVLEFRTFLLDAFDHRHEFGADEDHFAPGVVQHVDDFRWSQAPVDADQHDVGLERTQQHLEENVGVHAHVADPRARLLAEGDQAVCYLGRVLVERRVGGFAALEIHGGRVAAQFGLLARDIGQDLEAGEIVHS